MSAHLVTLYGHLLWKGSAGGTSIHLLSLSQKMILLFCSALEVVQWAVSVLEES